MAHAVDGAPRRLRSDSIDIHTSPSDVRAGRRFDVQAGRSTCRWNHLATIGTSRSGRTAAVPVAIPFTLTDSTHHGPDRHYAIAWWLGH
jgi:hypothetical protein